MEIILIATGALFGALFIMKVAWVVYMSIVDPPANYDGPVSGWGDDQEQWHVQEASWLPDFKKSQRTELMAAAAIGAR